MPPMSGFSRFLIAMLLPGSLAAGIAVGALAVYAAFDHNTQGLACDSLAPAESHDLVLHGVSCAIVWDQVIGMFACGVVGVSTLGVAVTTLLYWWVWVISTLAAQLPRQSRRGAKTRHA
jgi:hypothetical protein